MSSIEFLSVALVALAAVRCIMSISAKSSQLISRLLTVDVGHWHCIAERERDLDVMLISKCDQK